MPRKKEEQKREQRKEEQDVGQKREKRREDLEITIPRRLRKERPRAIPYVDSYVPRGKEFLAVDGRRIRNLAELAEALDLMDDHAFRYHANGERNDFSNWIRDVMGLPGLAGRLQDKDRRGAEIELLKHIINALRERR
jgi:hypothetical protein